MEPNAPNALSRSLRVVWCVGALGMALSLASAAWFWQEARRLDQIRFDELTHRLTEDLDTQTEKVETMLRSLAREMGGEPSIATWDEFMNQAAPEVNFPGLLCVGIATNDSAGSVLKAMEPWLRDDQPRGKKEFFRMVSPLNGPRQWRAWTLEVFREGVEPTGRFLRRELSVSNVEKSFRRLRFQEPQTITFHAECPFVAGAFYQLGERVVFQDTETDRIQDAAARDEVQLGRDLFPLQATHDAPLHLVTMVVPVPHARSRACWGRFEPVSGEKNEDLWLCWQLNAGFIFADLDFTTILNQIQGEVRPEIGVEIHTERWPTVETWLNPKPGAVMRANNPDRRSTFARFDPWLMYGEVWGLHFYTTPIFDQRSTVGRAWWAGGTGLAVTALVCWALGVQTRGRFVEARRATELKEARNALQAVHKERERLGHDLHDGAIQSLYAIQLGLTRAGRAVEMQAPETALTLQESRASLDAVIGELREFITEMKRDETRRPAVGFAAVLDSLVRRLRAASSAAIMLEADAAASACLTSAQALQLTAIAREALSNSLRHARSQNITVRLTGNAAAIQLEVSDDGMGFDPEHPASAGMGLTTMKQRAADLGAALKLGSAPGQGTRIRVELPLERTADREAGNA